MTRGRKPRAAAVEGADLMPPVAAEAEPAPASAEPPLAARIWAGQSISLSREQRVARIAAAYADRGLMFDESMIPGE